MTTATLKNAWRKLTDRFITEDAAAQVITRRQLEIVNHASRELQTDKVNPAAHGIYPNLIIVRTTLAHATLDQPQPTHYFSLAAQLNVSHF